MSLRRTALLGLLVTAVAAILGSAVPAFADSNATPLPLAQAQLLAAAPSDTPSGSSTTSVDGTTVLNASRTPGAQTEIDPDLSADAAVGLVAPAGNAIFATRPVCWANAAWRQWGTWPYQQRITDTTYWCAVYGSHITFRTATTTASGTLCGVAYRANSLIGGGIGRSFTYFTNRASAGFSCQTIIPWITLHTSHHEDVKRTDRGVTTWVGYG